jgi:LemA protein
MSITLLLTFLLSAGIALVIWLYNRLVRSRNLVSNAWSDIDVQLVRRHDLVPQLVEAVKAYAGYERATLEAVTELRAQSMGAITRPQQAAIEDALSEGVNKLIVVAEDYPDLKADQNFRDLQNQLTEVENHLQHARRFYNGAVRDHNIRVASFPDLVVARLFGFSRAEFFAAEAEARVNVTLGL